jgi:hypothetical protein
VAQCNASHPVALLKLETEPASMLHRLG